uniref:Secreted protein n=1 Tax=Steinernema glaseri TaxID=37863 RepID=A0A1I7XXF3_9BILA
MLRHVANVKLNCQLLVVLFDVQQQTRIVEAMMRLWILFSLFFLLGTAAHIDKPSTCITIHADVQARKADRIRRKAPDCLSWPIQPCMTVETSEESK